MKFLPSEASARCTITGGIDEKGEVKQKTKTFRYVNLNISPETLYVSMTALMSLTEADLYKVQLVTTNEIEG